jgi:hypothetical protein
MAVMSPCATVWLFKAICGGTGLRTHAHTTKLYFLKVICGDS